MDLKETEWEWVHWIYLAEGRDRQRAVLNTVMNLQIQKKDVNFCLEYVTVSLRKRALLLRVHYPNNTD